MALYKYLAVPRGEAPQEILIEADNEKEALDKLRSRHVTPIRFFGETMVGKRKGLSLHRSKIDPYAFTRQLAPLLESYIPLERALAIIAEGTAEKEQKEFVNALRQGLHEGKKFSELVRSHGSVFPSYYANLIESGEETGCLPEVVNQLYKFMDQSKEFRDFIISSSIYPLVILTITLLVTVLLFTVFVPRFARIFADMGRTMPPSMEFLLTVSAIASWAWWLIPLALAATWILLERKLGKELLRKHVWTFLLKLPLAGKIIVDLEMCKYIRTLSILIGNHVEIIRTVKISGKIIGNPVIANAFTDIARKLKGGSKLSAALADNHYIPSSMVPMLRVGEESGTVGEMLSRIASHLENDTRLKIKRLLSLFEPAVIVFLAVMVLIVVVSIFVAMMDLNAINQGGPKI